MDEDKETKEERKRLEEQYGEIWNTSEVGKVFRIVSFSAPYVSVVRKEDGVEGWLEFQPRPRFYFNFQPVG